MQENHNDDPTVIVMLTVRYFAFKDAKFVPTLVLQAFTEMTLQMIKLNRLKRCAVTR